MRGRNRPNKGPNPLTRSYESNGPDVKIRGTAQHIAEKYSQLARDAQASSDPVAAENYFQHAEHYFRLIAAAQEQLREQFGYQRDEDGDEDGFQGAGGYGNGEDGDFGSQPQPYDNRQDSRQDNRQDNRQDRGDRNDGERQPRFDRGDRPDRGDGQDRRERFQRDRGPRQDFQRPDAQRGDDQRPERQDRHERGDRQDRGPRQDRGDRAPRQDFPRGQDSRGADFQRDGQRQDNPRQDSPRQDGSRQDGPRQDGPRQDRDRGEFRRERREDPAEPVEANGLPAFLTNPIRQPIVAAAAEEAGVPAPEANGEFTPRPRARRRRPAREFGDEAAPESGAEFAPGAVDTPVAE
jgi:hypothetical protein